ncbi:unnamed protein product [Boreogadus saida]
MPGVAGDVGVVAVPKVTVPKVTVPGPQGTTGDVAAGSRGSARTAVTVTPLFLELLACPAKHSPTAYKQGWLLGMLGNEVLEWKVVSR